MVMSAVAAVHAGYSMEFGSAREVGDIQKGKKVEE
jgi:hypothetical protein